MGSWLGLGLGLRMEGNMNVLVVRERRWRKEDKKVLHMLIGVSNALLAPDLRCFGCLESRWRHCAYDMPLYGPWLA